MVRNVALPRQNHRWFVVEAWRPAVLLIRFLRYYEEVSNGTNCASLKKVSLCLEIYLMRLIKQFLFV